MRRVVYLSTYSRLGTHLYLLPMYYFRHERVHHVDVGYFFTVPILLVALHLLEGAGPSEADGYTVLVLLVRQMRRRARLPSFRGGEHRCSLAARWPQVGGAAAGVVRLCFVAGSVESVTRLRFGARLPS